jgi:hypothetical protein
LPYLLVAPVTEAFDHSIILEHNTINVEL